uniref:Uncharacterized protein n=1 Tax=Manihot esculenta TaxID=3983 RepID=A0A2C9W295_MANES
MPPLQSKITGGKSKGIQLMGYRRKRIIIISAACET